MLSFKLAFSFSSFTFIKRLFSSSLLSAIRAVSSAYLRLLIFLPVILIPDCDSSSPAFCLVYSAYRGFPDGASGKEPACQCKRCKRHWFDPWVGKISWRRAWQPTSVFLPGQFHGQRSLGGCSPWGCKRIGHNLKETNQQQTVQPPLAWTREDSPLCPSPVHQAIFALAPDPSVPLAIPNDLCSQGNHDQFSCLSALFDLEDFFFFSSFLPANFFF